MRFPLVNLLRPRCNMPTLFFEMSNMKVPAVLKTRRVVKTETMLLSWFRYLTDTTIMAVCELIKIANNCYSQTKTSSAEKYFLLTHGREQDQQDFQQPLAFPTTCLLFGVR